MSVEYRLRFDLRVPDTQVCEVIVTQAGLIEERREVIVLGRSLGKPEEEHGEMIVFQGTGIFCFFHPESSLGQSIIEEAFGFRPTKNITFRIDKFEHYEDGILNMLCTCIAIIKSCTSDCVLLENGDIPLLLRKRGHLTLQSGDSYWSAKLEFMAREIGDPYIFKPMSVI